MDLKQLRREKPRGHAVNSIRFLGAIDDNNKRRKEYEDEKRAFIKSDDGKRDVSARQILQTVNEEQTKCVDSIETQLKELKRNLYNFIVEELNYSNRSIKEIEFAELEQIINECLPAFKMLKRFSNDKVFKERVYGKNYSIYESLFNDLIALDARFAIFAPYRSINKSDLQSLIKKLPASLMFEVERIKKRLNKNEKADYVALHQVVEFEPENTRVEKVQSFMKPVKKEVMSTAGKMAKVAENLSDDIYNHFVNQIEIYKDKKGKVSDGDMENIVMLARGPKRKFEELANNRFIIKKAQWETDVVQDLLDKLQLLDPRIEFKDLSANVTDGVTE